MKINLKGSISKLSNWILKFIKNHPLLSIFIGCFVLILIFSFFLIEPQKKLSNLTVEIIGALLIIVIFQFIVVNVITKSSYPKTKGYIYGQLTGALANIGNDLIENYLKLDIKDFQEREKGIIQGDKFSDEGIKLLS